MLINVEFKNDYVICRYNENKITNNEHSHLRDSIERIFDSNNKYIVLDLTKVNYISSPGIGSLISINDHCNKLSEKNGVPFKFVIFGLNATNENLIKMLKVDTFIKIVHSEDEAINFLKNNEK